MRLFIALCFDRQVRRQIRDVQKRLGALARRGALTPEENLHLTLAFLGRCRRHGWGRCRRPWRLWIWCP